MIIKKSVLYTGLVLVLIVIGAFLFFRSSDSNTNGNDINGKTVDVQNVVIGIKNANYYPNTINVKAEVPVRISLDSSVTGCYRGFNIKQLGVSKLLKTPNDYVEFTPTKGTYRFTCSMGMGTGTLIVE
ncbi:MAG: cupredoxin domain-containing protein [Nanoarchaeota archaeon]